MFPGGIASYSLFLLTALRSPLTLEVPGFRRHNIAEACAGYVFNDPLPAGTPAAACMNAIISGDESGALTQLELGADVNACDEVGLTLMHHAAQAGMLRLINDLKRRGADINARGIVNESVLTYVILSNARDQTPRNHLHEVIDFMVRNRADLDSRDSYQMTPVMHAARLGDAIALNKLRQGRANLFLEDSNGYNALCYAAIGGRPLTVNYLLQAGVDPRVVVSTRGLVPSSLAQEALMQRQYSEEIQTSLRQCITKLCLGEAIADAYDVLGESPVGRDLTQAFDDVPAFRKAHLRANTQGNVDRCMACLHILGEIIGLKEPSPDSPEYQLLASCYHNNVPALQQVLERNVPLNLQNNIGRTALTLAVLGRHHEAAQTLLDWRANTEIPDVLGLTPLMFAATNGDTQMVNMLLARHANPLARDWQGLTAYDYAMMYLHDDQASRDCRTPEETAQCFIPHPVASRLLVAMQEWQRAETRLAMAEQHRHLKCGLQLS